MSQVALNLGLSSGVLPLHALCMARAWTTPHSNIFWPLSPSRAFALRQLSQTHNGGPERGARAQLLLESPVMLEGELAAVQGSSGLRTQAFGLHYASGEPGALEAALRALCADVEAAVRNGCEVGGTPLIEISRAW